MPRSKNRRPRKKPIGEKRCICEVSKFFQNRNFEQLSDGKALPYPDPRFEKVKSKVFRIKYEKKLSSLDKLVLNNLQKKYLYYAIDDILYLLKSKYIELNNLLSIIYSPVLSLQNNLSINFFDIWIQEIYINEVSKINKFIIDDSESLEQFHYITIRLMYKDKIRVKKQNSLW
jgi:hypothetical protein